MYSWLFCILLLFCEFLIPLCIDAAPPYRESSDQQNLNSDYRLEREQRDRMEEQKKEVAKYVKYMNYLVNVLNILQATPQWKVAMQNMTQEEMRDGKIAELVDHLEPHVIEQLAKVKLLELQRLKEERDQLKANSDPTDSIKVPEHLDFSNWETFSKEDLRKLVVKTVADMEELEGQRREDFKKYEMKKKAEEDHRVAQMTEVERIQYLRQMEEQRQRHNNHEKLKHPGSRDQLEEAWEDTDKLDKDTFDPRTFFALHDLNSDGYWSYDELSTIFLAELGKIYNSTDPDSDPNERIEELYRMREHVMIQMDKNGDRQISLDEFLTDSEVQSDTPDRGWEDIGDKEQYTKEELEEFEKEYARQRGWGEYAYSTPAPTLLPSIRPAKQMTGHPDQLPVLKPGELTARESVNKPVQYSQIPVQHPVQLNIPIEQQAIQQPAHQSQQVDKTYGI